MNSIIKDSKIRELIADLPHQEGICVPKTQSGMNYSFPKQEKRHGFLLVFLDNKCSTHFN
jgi:hypothetical protein